MLIGAHSKIKAINKSTGGLFSCFNYIFLTKPLNFPWINAVASPHCVFVRGCFRERVCVLMLHGYEAAVLHLLQVHEDLEGISDGYVVRQPPHPKWQEPSKSCSHGLALTWEEVLRGSGEAATWGSCVWILMEMLVSVESEKERGPPPSAVHSWCLVKRGCCPGRAVSYMWYFLTSSRSTHRAFPYPDAAAILWEVAEYNLCIFVQEEEEDPFYHEQKLSYANSSRLAIL